MTAAKLLALVEDEIDAYEQLIDTAQVDSRVSSALDSVVAMRERAVELGGGR